MISMMNREASAPEESASRGSSFDRITKRARQLPGPRLAIFAIDRERVLATDRQQALGHNRGVVALRVGRRR